MGSYFRKDYGAEEGMKSLLLVGLGNPGKKFQGTRHNVGFGIVDRVADVVGVCWVSRKGGDVEVARVKVKYGGSDGGHRGLRSLDERIGRGYWRVRIGIGRGVGEVEDYVLGRFRGGEREVMDGVMERVAGGLGELCGGELSVARGGVFVGGLG